jgi:hypothetical protein
MRPASEAANIRWSFVFRLQDVEEIPGHRLQTGLTKALTATTCVQGIFFASKRRKAFCSFVHLGPARVECRGCASRSNKKPQLQSDRSSSV